MPLRGRIAGAAEMRVYSGCSIAELVGVRRTEDQRACIARARDTGRIVVGDTDRQGLVPHV